MTYTVLWKPSAEAELVRIWTEAAERTAVAAAANEIDRLLKMNVFVNAQAPTTPPAWNARPARPCGECLARTTA